MIRWFWIRGYFDSVLNESNEIFFIVFLISGDSDGINKLNTKFISIMVINCRKLPTIFELTLLFGIFHRWFFACTQFLFQKSRSFNVNIIYSQTYKQVPWSWISRMTMVFDIISLFTHRQFYWMCKCWNVNISKISKSFYKIHCWYDLNTLYHRGNGFEIEKYLQWLLKTLCRFPQLKKYCSSSGKILASLS